MQDEIRAAAFRWLEEQTAVHDDALPRRLLQDGFEYRGSRVTLVGPSGIWKPRGFETVPLSITSTPKGPYDDSMSPDGLLIYRYRGDDPNHRDNVGLREAMRTRTPLIYFFGVAVGRYLPIWPVFIIEDDPVHLRCFAAIDPAYAMKGITPMDENLIYREGDESALSIRRYILSYTRRRLHQTAFRERVISAYHDNNIIGITPDYEIELRRDILEEIDGPMLRYGLQELHHSKLLLPSRKSDWPDRERLEIRYGKFWNAG